MSQRIGPAFAAAAVRSRHTIAVRRREHCSPSKRVVRVPGDGGIHREGTLGQPDHEHKVPLRDLPSERGIEDAR